MKTISIVNQKGGCGKTTTALNMAINLSFEEKKVILLDTDPQQSAKETIQSRSDNTLKVVSIKSNIHKATQNYLDYDYVVIDSPPQNDTIARSVVICADLVIVPIQDSPLDIRSAKKTVELIMEAQKHNSALKSYFLLNRIQANTILARDLKKHLRKIYKTMGILKSEIHNRVVYKQSLIYGQAVTEYEKLGIASNEINGLTQEVIQTLK